MQRNILFAIDFCTATQYFFATSFSVSGCIWPIAKNIVFGVWPRIVQRMRHELSRAQTKISVAHRNYGLKWLNAATAAAAAAASATPVRRFSQSNRSLLLVLCVCVLRLCFAWALFVCARTSSHGVCVCHNSMDLKRIARRRRQFKPLAFCVYSMFFALRTASAAAAFIWPQFFALSPVLGSSLSGRFSCAFQCASRQHGCWYWHRRQ